MTIVTLTVPAGVSSIDLTGEFPGVETVTWASVRNDGSDIVTVTGWPFAPIPRAVEPGTICEVQHPSSAPCMLGVVEVEASVETTLRFEI